MKILVSVPEYNCEEYIEEGVESQLAERNLYDIEILLDDGSIDRSGVICEECASRCQEIKVFHTVNRGVSCAENDVIEESTGDWIMFVDAVNVLIPNTLSFLDKQANFQRNEIKRFGAYHFGKGIRTS